MRVRNIFAVTISALLLITGASATGAAPEAKEVYLIKFADNVNLDNEIAALKAGGGDVRFEYRNVFKGAAVAMNSAQASGLSRNPRIVLVAKDQIATTQATQGNLPSGLWGLDRIDATTDSTYTYAKTGKGVTAYVVDTGIDIKNTVFGGRAVWGRNFVDANNSDCNGHGTHVAGTIGSSSFGVAKDVSLVAIKVLNCQGSGSYSGIIAALDWLSANGKKPAVANMSLGGPVYPLLNEAIARLTSSGITVVVAAGNESTDACTKSPASATSAITVGAASSSNSGASFTNFGTCVDLFAPGVGILSTLPKNKTGTWSGTSMASPHVAGVVARYLETNPQALVSDVSQAITTEAKSGLLSSIGTGSPNLFLYRSGTN